MCRRIPNRRCGEGDHRLGNRCYEVVPLCTIRVGDINGRSLYNSRMQAPAVRLPDYLPDAIRRITRELDPLQIILFGSWARGDARPDSDLDLLIVMPKIDSKRETAIRALRALRDLPVGKDVVVTTPQEIEERGDEIGLVLRPALREGIVVYANE